MVDVSTWLHAQPSALDDPEEEEDSSNMWNKPFKPPTMRRPPADDAIQCIEATPSPPSSPKRNGRSKLLVRENPPPPLPATTAVTATRPLIESSAAGNAAWKPLVSRESLGGRLAAQAACARVEAGGPEGYFTVLWYVYLPAQLNACGQQVAGGCAEEVDC